MVIKIAALTMAACAVLLVAGGLLFMASGFYNIAADTPHVAVVRWLLTTGRTRSVEFHSRGIKVPNLRDQLLLKSGFVLYRKNCQPCHGAPGIAGEEVGRGINPKPPSLMTTTSDWSDPQLYWIVSHGLKMSGMPAFSPRLSDQDRWGIVAFLGRINRLSPADYQQLMEAVDQNREPTHWGEDDAPGFGEIRAGNRDIGRRLLSQYGCITCHTIPGIGSGQVGPPLTGFAERQYIAGSLVNLPTNVMNWIVNPQRYKPNTAMPKLDVKSGEAADIAAFLFTLGSRKRIDALLRTSSRPQ